MTQPAPRCDSIRGPQRHRTAAERPSSGRCTLPTGTSRISDGARSEKARTGSVRAAPPQVSANTSIHQFRYWFHFNVGIKAWSALRRQQHTARMGHRAPHRPPCTGAGARQRCPPGKTHIFKPKNSGAYVLALLRQSRDQSQRRADAVHYVRLAWRHLHHRCRRRDGAHGRAVRRGERILAWRLPENRAPGAAGACDCDSRCQGEPAR